MFHKKKFTLVEQKNEKKMYNAKSIKWLNYLVVLALIAFVLLMILANVKSKSYYQNLNASKKANQEITSGARSILPLDEISSRAVDCSISYCSVTCTGDMTDLNQYLNNQKSCTSMSLTILDCTFPNDRLQSDWLKGSFSLSYINITRATLHGIDSGAFNQNSVANMIELKLDRVQLPVLTEDTFVGLKAVEKFTLINQVEIFAGDSFLKPMVKTLRTLTIKQLSNTATDPGPWLRGGDYPNLFGIYFENNNFGGYIKMDTFQHLKSLQFLSMSSCEITFLPDGIFDFMMKHFGVYIFLHDNQLKRIAGNYLKKVNFSQLWNLQIVGNPWDCTCELEDLITEFKRSPKGFGENTKCSTPTEHAGKVLSEVVVERCEDTTTALTTTPLPITTTTTTTTVSSSSSSTTEASEDPELTEPPPSSPEITLPTSTTTLTTSSTESTPTSSTEPTSTAEVTTSTTSLTTSSTESTIPTTSTEPTSESPEVTTSTTVSTTLPEDEITSPPPQTTPSPQNRTTTMSADQIVTIECQRYNVDSPGSSEHYVELSRPDTQFYITSLSETSAQLTMEPTSADLALIWFYDQPMINGSGENVRIVGEFKIGCQSDLDDSLLIEGLAQRRAYTFCLVKEGVQVVSPFNCLSYYSSEGVIGGIDEREVWLKCEDKALIIGLLIFGIVMSICIGAVGMFLILRAQPILLKGSKRVIVVNRSTGDVLIMPRPAGKSSTTDSSYKDSFETNTTIRQRRFSETSIQSGRSYMMANNYEDIEYRWKMNVVNDMIYANRVPKSPPPPLPKRMSQDVPIKSTHDDKMKVSVVYQKGNDYGYIASTY